MDLNEIMPPDDGLPDVSEFMAARPVREGENWTFAPGDRVQVKATDNDLAAEGTSRDTHYARFARDNNGNVGWVYRSSVGCTASLPSCLDSCGLVYLYTDSEKPPETQWDAGVLRFRVDQVVHID